MTRSWLIGKGADCDVIVDRPTVSEHHCRLTREDGDFVLDDLGSSNGTYVNGERLTSRARVTPVDAVTLGRHVPLPWPAEALPPGWKSLRIGREPDNDFLVNLPNVSGYHARILWNGATGEAIVEDLGSTNGTALGSPDRRVTRSALAATDTIYLGSHPLPAAVLLARVASVHDRRVDRPVAVEPGDMIGLGTSRLQLAVEDAEAAPGKETANERGVVPLPTPTPASNPPAVERAPSPWWSVIRPTIAGILRPGWRLAVLLAQAPLAAGLIVLAFLLPVKAPMDPGDRAGISRSIAAGLFWLGFTAAGTGLTCAILGGTSCPGTPPAVGKWGRIARIVTRMVVLGLAAGIPCALALGIVHPGIGLKGPGLPMLGLLLLAFAVGLSLGLALVSLVPRPAFALAFIPIGLLPMWLLGGQRQPLATMSPMARRAADVLPARWAFEGLLLLEAGHETPAGSPSTAPGSTPEHDLAESYFPAATERMGVKAGTIALGSMLIGLFALAAFIAGARDAG